MSHKKVIAKQYFCRQQTRVSTSSQLIQKILNRHPQTTFQMKTYHFIFLSRDFFNFLFSKFWISHEKKIIHRILFYSAFCQQYMLSICSSLHTSQDSHLLFWYCDFGTCSAVLNLSALHDSNACGSESVCGAAKSLTFLSS